MKTVLNALFLLDAFALGGLVAVLLVREMLLNTMYVLISPAAQAEILNVLDKLLPYTLGYAGATLLLGLITLSAFVGTRVASRPPW